MSTRLVKQVSIPEWGRLIRGKNLRLNPEFNRANWISATLSTNDFKDVLKLLKDSDQQDIKPFFRFSLVNGIEVLTSQNYVGVIQTSSGCQIEILPKISKWMSQEDARVILVKMLVELKDSPFKEATMANLDPRKMPLFELVIRLFLNYVQEIIKKGIARQYVDLQNNLVFLRGKLQLYEHIRRNSVDRSRFYCEYDEFERNRPINRLIKQALLTVSKLSKSSINLQTCKEQLHWFDNVPASQDFRMDFRAIKQDRFIQHYEKALQICRLILEQMNPLTRPGQHEVFSMLFDMNRVFENYVAAKLNSNLSEWQIEPKVERKYLVEEHENQNAFELIPDLELKQKAKSEFKFNSVIADAKWKLLDETKPSFAISRSDVYQLFAYAKKFMIDQDLKIVVLIYPKTEQFGEPLQPFWFKKGLEVLYVIPFDLIEDKPVTTSLVNPFKVVH
ncbi:MAG: McrC family protein [Gammaproteobacteria bacterium]|nr:McrC family protein [Gammaproteobacteria bacterium]